MAILDPRTFYALKQNKNYSIFRFEYSHYSHVFQCLFQFVKKNGLSPQRIIVTTPDFQMNYLIEVNLEEFEISAKSKSSTDLRALNSSSVAVFSHDIDYIVGGNQFFKEAVTFFSPAACHWLESDSHFTSSWLHDLYVKYLLHVDKVITPSPRMTEIFWEFLNSFGPVKDHSLTYLSPVLGGKSQTPRAQAKINLNIPTNSILMVSTGGLWSWTSAKEFVLAFHSVQDFLEKNKIFFLQLGGVQPSNTDQVEHINGIREIIKNGKSKNFLMINDWQDASRLISTSLSAADCGLLFEKDNLESWQALRRRSLDYASYSLPIASTNPLPPLKIFGKSRHIQIPSPTLLGYKKFLLSLPEQLNLNTNDIEIYQNFDSNDEDLDFKNLSLPDLGKHQNHEILQSLLRKSYFYNNLLIESKLREKAKLMSLYDNDIILTEMVKNYFSVRKSLQHTFNLICGFIKNSFKPKIR